MSSDLRYLGLDIGSRQIKGVALGDNGGLESVVVDTGSDPYSRSLDIVREFSAERVVATGYGRHVAKGEFAHAVVTEIKAHARGARHLFSGCRSVIDIGGQDSKVILLDERGGVDDFQMNDRCAAGTGKFLEVMAATLGFSLGSFGSEALEADAPVKVNSMCTVFAESEVVSLLARKVPARRIALGLHEAIAERIMGMAKRIGVTDEIVFSGGVAYNPCVRSLLEKRLGRQIRVSERPELVGALGAALLAREE
ncbi:MAG: acyl-CoA dehydratase activase [Chloroflexi bacterium]|nr:acyl-CoA dehydratase activase [Chloroflexota bacterium]